MLIPSPSARVDIVAFLGIRMVIGSLAIARVSMTIEANTENILKRQDEILAKINELKHPITVIPPNINGMFIRGHHIKLRYVVAIVAIILMWAVAASVSSLKYKEESFAHYSMYRAVKEQHQHLIEKAGIRLTENLE